METTRASSCLLLSKVVKVVEIVPKTLESTRSTLSGLLYTQVQASVHDKFLWRKQLLENKHIRKYSELSTTKYDLVFMLCPNI
jgi:hypothetical protein